MHSMEQIIFSEHGLAPSSVQVSPASPFMDDTSTDDDMETYVSPEDKSGNDFAPRKGMKFTSLEAFESFYHNFAISEGYTARIKTTIKFPHSDQIRYRHYVCSCEGFCRERKSNDKSDLDQEKVGRRTLTRRCGCLVSITVSNKNGIWVVGKINKEHNHLLVSPNSRVYLKKPGRMPSVAKSLVEKFSETDLPIGRVPDIVNCDASINVSQRDCWNHRRDLRRKNLDSGDATAVLVYCVEKKSQDPNFFYAIQTDEEDRMVNFFWIDSTARQYYERFGDVLVFDTTYKTNKYGLPLGNFVGVNNHSQSIMFGFALLQNEQEHTFVWLFETWLHAVGGKTPISILTDQDRAIQNAIEKVFPTVTHRFCLWHIMTKFPERYGSLYKDNSPFGRDLNNCLYKSITIEQFDNEWKKIMEDYELVEDEWLNKLFEIRQSWPLLFNLRAKKTGRCDG